MEDLKLAKQLSKALERAIVREREAQNFYMNQATNSYEYDVKKLF
jgi:rubrerythrin